MRLLCPWDFPGKNTGVGCCFPNQGSNPVSRIAGRRFTVWATREALYPEGTVIEKDTCTPVFIAALFTIARMWKQPRCPSGDEWIKKLWYIYTMIQFSKVAQSCPTLCNPMNRSTPGLPIHHKLPESTQTHAHRVGDAIQPSHPLLSPPPPAPNLSQHQGLFQWVNSSHEVAKVLELQLQHQSFQWTPRTYLLSDGLQSKGVSRVFSNTIVQKHQFFGTQLSLYSNSHIHTWLLEKP